MTLSTWRSWWSQLRNWWLLQARKSRQSEGGRWASKVSRKTQLLGLFVKIFWEERSLCFHLKAYTVFVSTINSLAQPNKSLQSRSLQLPLHSNQTMHCLFSIHLFPMVTNDDVNACMPIAQRNVCMPMARTKTSGEEPDVIKCRSECHCVVVTWHMFCKDRAKHLISSYVLFFVVKSLLCNCEIFWVVTFPKLPLWLFWSTSHIAASVAYP